MNTSNKLVGDVNQALMTLILDAIYTIKQFKKGSTKCDSLHAFYKLAVIRVDNFPSRNWCSLTNGMK